MTKLQEVKGQFSITLPKLMVQQKKWGKGKELLFVFNERGNIEITEKL